MGTPLALKMTSRLQFVTLLTLMFISRAGANTGELPHMLTVSGGISSPGMTTSLGENPSGLIYNQTPKVLGALVSASQGIRNLGYGAGFFTGNGDVGAGIMLQGFNSSTSSPGNVMLVNWGLASYFSNIDMAWGFTGTHTIFERGDPGGTGSGTTWCIDTGGIFNPNGRVRLGWSVFQLLNDVDALAAGIAVEGGKSATFTVDAAFHTKTQGQIVKPGLKVHFNDFQLSSGFGIQLKNRYAWINSGLTLGLSAKIGSKSYLQGYVRQIGQYYLAYLLRI